MLEILPMKEEDTPEAARAHINYLKSPLQSAGGYGMLVAQYQAIARQAGAVGFVARLDGRFAGFICGVWDRSALKKGLLAAGPALVLNTVRQFLSNPTYFVYRLTRRLFYFKQAEKVYSGYELRPIVVLPEFRGHGIADRLVDRLIADARQRGFAQIFLFTEHDNEPASRFYSRYGFVLEDEIVLHAGTPYALLARHYVYKIES